MSEWGPRWLRLPKSGYRKIDEPYPADGGEFTTEDPDPRELLEQLGQALGHDLVARPESYAEVWREYLNEVLAAGRVIEAARPMYSPNVQNIDNLLAALAAYDKCACYPDTQFSQPTEEK